MPFSVSNAPRGPIAEKDLSISRPFLAWLIQSFLPASEVGIDQLTGDVTAGPGSGSQAATIAADAVTFAKMQEITTQRLIGRNTAGTGNPEEVTISQALDWLGP